MGGARPVGSASVRPWRLTSRAPRIRHRAKRVVNRECLRIFRRGDGFYPRPSRCEQLWPAVVPPRPLPAGPVACLLVTAFVPPAVSPVSCGCVAGPPGPSSRRAVCGARFTGAWSFDFFCFFSGCHLMGFG